MIDIHGFWTDLFPIFQENAEFVYYFLDALSVVSFFRIITLIPELLLTGRMRGGRW